MATSWRGWCWQLGLVSFLAMGEAIAFSGSWALAQSQITPDSTLGAESSVVTSNVNIKGIPSDQVDGGAIRGSNLFHSFEQFKIDAGRGVYFTNPAGVENILSRVTGGNPSEILGKLGVLGNANLFLINPNGIIFGPSASLDVGGSFVASTASSLKFADETQFSATKPQTTPLLTVSVPIGLQFGERAGQILVQGSGAVREGGILLNRGLQVQPSKTLALVGNGVALQGGIVTTDGGRIELNSVAAPDLVSLNPINKGWALGNSGISTGNISLSNAAAVDASGTGGGDIQVQGKQVTLKDGSQIEIGTFGSEQGGTLDINASELVELVGISTKDNSRSTIVTLVYQGATGTGGNVNIRTGRLVVRDGAVVAAGTYRNSEGQGGNLSVTASESVELGGTTPNGRFVSSLSTQTQGAGSAGYLNIETKKLVVQEGGQVSADTRGQGKGGELRVHAIDSVNLSGVSPRGNSSGLFTITSGLGQAGNITVSTGNLTIQDGARVSVGSSGSGNAGNLQVQANSIQLENGGKLLSTSTLGKGGGDITLKNSDLLLLRGNSEISTTAGGAGNGGNINIDTDLLVGTENSDITANAVEGRGGKIQINTQGIFGIGFRSQRTPESDITATSQKGIDGVVEINRPEFDPNANLVVLPAEIVDISGLIAQGCPAVGSNVASGESKFVVTGRGGLPPTSRETLNSDGVLEDWGTPALATAQPQISQKSDRPKTENRFPNHIVSNNATHPTPTPLVEAQGWVIGDNGEVVLTASASNVASYSPWLTPTACHGN